MKKLLSKLVVCAVILVGCDSTQPEKDVVSKEHAGLFGEWREINDKVIILWDFDRYELTWNGFSHFYQVSGDSLIISGLSYRIIEQTEQKLTLINPKSDTCVLRR